MGIAKWILAGLGWACGGPIGALLGYFFGKAISSDNARISSGAYSNPSRTRYANTGGENDLTVALMVLIASVMKADGAVRQSELNYVKQFLLKNYGEGKAKDLLVLIRDLVKKEIYFDEVCAQIKANTDYTTRYHMFDFLFGVAGADAAMHPSEIRILKNIATRLGINSRDYLSIYSRHAYAYQDNSGSSYSSSGSSSTAYTKDPYKILGIDSTATDDEVKKAYRRLALKYHPDKVEGMGEEIKKNAERQFREINEAYETIKQVRGMK